MVTLTNTRDDTWTFRYLVKTKDHPKGESHEVHLGAMADHGVAGKVQPVLRVDDDIWKKIKHQVGEMSTGINPRIRVST